MLSLTKSDEKLVSLTVKKRVVGRLIKLEDRLSKLIDDVSV